MAGLNTVASECLRNTFFAVEYRVKEVSHGISRAPVAIEHDAKSMEASMSDSFFMTGKFSDYLRH
jgi:hypothetical protein